MNTPLGQHQIEIQGNLRAWNTKPLLRAIYASFYERIIKWVDPSLPGQIVEIGAGIGNLKQRLPGALATDLFCNPWLDLVCDGYELPFVARSLSHLLLFDVFHHLEAPGAFLREARRVLKPGGRLVVFEPYVSCSSYPVYGLLHHEPVAWRRDILAATDWPRPRPYYAAQGNATRVFFGWNGAHPLWGEWTMLHREAFAAFAYLLSGGFSRPAFYPAGCLGRMQQLDRFLTRWPRLFGARCLVVLESAGNSQSQPPSLS